MSWITSCKLRNKLLMLSKSSISAIEDANSSEDSSYQEYIHVKRRLESDFIDKLRVLKNKKKYLFLVCGSAGDGKSHLINYLRNHDDEGLFLDFTKIYNDATESDRPTQTYEEALADRLSSFNDDNIKCNDDAKIMVAINLGTLSNFIYSDKGEKFSYLKEFVLEKGILINGIRDNPVIDCDCCFDYISFSDYPIFELKKNDAEIELQSEFIDSLMDKVFDQSDGNIFYDAFTYCNKANCTKADKCPLRWNYDFLANNKIVRVNIRNIIVTSIIKNKLLLTARELLNFIFEMLVAPDFENENFEHENIQIGNSSSSDLLKFIKNTTPMLLFNGVNRSEVLDVIRSECPLVHRDKDNDSERIDFYSKDIALVKEDLSHLEENFKLYPNYLDDCDVSMDADVLKYIFTFIVRYKYLKCKNVQLEPIFEDYLKFVYAFNTDWSLLDEKLVGKIKYAISKWNSDEGDLCCIDNSNGKYQIFTDRKVEIKIDPSEMKLGPSSGVLYRFYPKIYIPLIVMQEKKVNLSIDYHTYVLFDDLGKGYKLTFKDKNKYTDFAGFAHRVQKVVGKYSDELVIVPKNKDFSRIKVKYYESSKKYNFE